MLPSIYQKIKPYYFLLFPAFFVLHIFNRYFGLVPPVYTIRYWGISALVAIVIYLLLKRWYKSPEKAGIFVSILLVVFFTFSTAKDFLNNNPILSHVSAYRYVSPALLLILAALCWYLKKARRAFGRFNFFLSLAITVIFGIECGYLCINLFTHAERKNDLGDPNDRIATGFTPCGNCPQPDVYFIVLDEFTSSDCLKQYWDYSNDTLNNYFREKHFFVSRSSHSNYSFTTFSLPATLEMQYLNLPPGYTRAQASDLSKGEYTIFNNNAFKVFEKQGYTIHNYSIFDVKGYPSPDGNYFRYLRQNYINIETLYGRVMKDMGWLLINPFVTDFHTKDSLYQHSFFADRDRYVQKTIATATDGILHQDPAKKDFFYIHLMFPHDPYIYNADGSLGSYGHPDSAKGYLEQVKYASTVLMNMIDRIQQSSSGKAVIIAQGDHGFKNWPGKGNYEKKAFANLNAFYFPDTVYTGLYNGISPVNTFRVVFNRFFNAQLPLLKDESLPVFIPVPSEKKIF